ncbi:MAG TPA: DNRLRE domain-containing protein [Verrucomicrobiae bacterium]|nr:DNRLRE domain-containing protein [Verrucomicrobiae bacterium]
MQNGRYNLDEASEPIYGVGAFDGNANGYWAVLQDVTSDRAEYNVNFAAGYFRYTNWLAGWARNATGGNGGTNNLFVGSPGLFLGTQFKGISSGRSRVDLTGFGINSATDGVLLVNHAKNEGNFALSTANPDGTWEIFVKDNFGNADNPFALEQDPCAFVFIPKTNTTVVSGKFGLDETGTNAVVLLHSGLNPSFAVTNIAPGRYRLTIPGGSPGSGVLITSCEGGYTNNFDNVISYEADGDGWIIESRDTGVYPPELEACTNEPVASFVFIPAASPGVTVTPANTLITTEYGVAASFTLELDLAPVNDVTINIASSNPLEGTVDLASVTFTTENWNVPQTVTVTGQDDAIADGPKNYSVVLSAAVSNDPNYNNLDPADVPVINMDDEQAGITVTPTSGLVTSESGDATTFAVFLNRPPTGDVIVGLSSPNLAEGMVSPNSVTFTPGDWNVPQIVTVTGVDDVKQDGDQTYSIITAPAQSVDSTYNGLNPDDVALLNRDNDTAGYVWNYHLPITVIEGSTTNYSLALGTQPETDVVIQITSDKPSVGAVSPVTLTFTPQNWNTPQNITLTGVDNLVTNANANLNLKHQPVTTDPIYSQLVSAITLPAIVIDNEAKLTLPSGDCIYGLGMPPIGIDGQATVEDADAISYANGSVTVEFTANGQANDHLEIRNTGDGIDEISADSTEVSYEGNVIGSFTGGSEGTPLIISLNAIATLPAVQQLIRSITFYPGTNDALITRSVQVSLDDGLGVIVNAAKQIRVGVLRLTQYQEGGDYGYGKFFGAADIALSQVGNSEPWPMGRTPAPQEGLLIDWPDGGTPNESQVLLRFDDFIGTNYWQVPTGAVVVSAELLLRVNNTGDGGTLHRMFIPWDATNDTWSSLGDGIQQDDIESRYEYESQVGVEDGSGSTGTGIISIGITPDVQAWVNGETNFGWVIKGWPLRTDGTGFTPSEYPVVNERPRLRITWMEPGNSVVSFQQGINDYAGTFDTNLREASPDENFAGEDTLWSDANDVGKANATQTLLRFDGIVGAAANQVPFGARIVCAMLDLPSVGTDAMGDGGQIYALLQPWEDTTTTWNNWMNGVQPDGVEAANSPSAVAGNSGLEPDVQGTVNSFDVTADVQAWANGIRQNYGWAILPWAGGANGWGNRSAEYYSFVDENNPNRDHPRLRIYYTMFGVVMRALLQAPLVSATQMQIHFLGTPEKTYSVFRAPSPAGPWSEIGTATVGTDGHASFDDLSPLPNSAFYRVIYK